MFASRFDVTLYHRKYMPGIGQVWLTSSKLACWRCTLALGALSQASMLRDSIEPGCLQDVLFAPQKGRSAPNSLEEERADGGRAHTSDTLKAAAASFPPKRVQRHLQVLPYAVALAQRTCLQLCLFWLLRPIAACKLNLLARLRMS